MIFGATGAPCAKCHEEPSMDNRTLTTEDTIPETTVCEKCLMESVLGLGPTHRLLRRVWGKIGKPN